LLTKAICRRSFTPAQPDCPAASVRDFLSGAYNFPRFVQFAIWRFCAEAGLNRCNGNRIDDRAPCEQTDCPVFESCARVPLKPA